MIELVHIGHEVDFRNTETEMIALRFQGWFYNVTFRAGGDRRNAGLRTVTGVGYGLRAVIEAVSHTYSCYCTWTATALKVNRSLGIRTVALRHARLRQRCSSRRLQPGPTQSRVGPVGLLRATTL